MKIKTNELTGKPLDYAVAVAEGYTPFTDGIAWIVDVGGTYTQLFKYSSKWVAGGPIIERERICVGWAYPRTVAEETQAVASYFEPIHSALETHRMFGPTPLIAAMRCYVASKLGDEVEVPEELK